MDVHLEFPRDLSPTEVAALARAAGLALGPDDLVDVTHRLNATLGAMAEIDHPDPPPRPSTCTGRRRSHRRRCTHRCRLRA